MTPLLPPCGGDAEGRGGLSATSIWYSPTDPPLSLRDISPRKGGRGESEDMHQALAGGEGDSCGGLTRGYNERASFGRYLTQLAQDLCVPSSRTVPVLDCRQLILISCRK